MRAGKLRHRVELQRSTIGLTAQGAPEETWTTIATVWASIKPLGGREGLLAKQVDPRLSHDVGLRFYSGLTPKDRVKFGTRIFHIHAVTIPNEIEWEMMCKCEERV